MSTKPTGIIKANYGSSLIIGGLGGLTGGQLYFDKIKDTLSNFTINDGAVVTLYDSLNIASTGVVQVGSSTGGTLNSDGYLTLVSDNAGTARVAQLPVNGSDVSLSSINGNVNVQCYIHSNLECHRYAAPSMAIDDGSYYQSWCFAGRIDLQCMAKRRCLCSGRGTLITVPLNVIASSPGLDSGVNSNYSLESFNVSTQSLPHITNTTVPISGSTGERG
ncbi:MAG: hypothetical protein WDM71_02515 [Ferruginibacter sp.]